MPTLHVDPHHPDPAVIARAAAIIAAGGLVAFPTETVYGLGANALDARAVTRIFEAKGRPSFNPVIAHVADVAAARALAAAWPEAAERLTQRFWPGPLTLVVPKRAHVPDVVTAGLPSVALRMPAHPVALALLRAAALPIAAPSANRFTELSPTAARHVERALGDRVDLILDGGPTTVGIESTVVDVSGERPVLLRPGLISPAELEPLVGELAAPAAPASADAPRPAPGMVERHYAPRATVRLFGSVDEALLVARGRAALMAWSESTLRRLADAAFDVRVQMPSTPAEYARELYATLHRLDDEGCTVVLVERVPSSAEWAGVRDRLERAAVSEGAVREGAVSERAEP